MKRRESDTNDSVSCNIELQMILEEANEVAREDVATWLSAGFIQQFTSPPSIFGSRSNCDDVVRLEVKLFVNRCLVIIKCFD